MFIVKHFQQTGSFCAGKTPAAAAIGSDNLIMKLLITPTQPQSYIVVFIKHILSLQQHLLHQSLEHMFKEQDQVRNVEHNLCLKCVISLHFTVPCKILKLNNDTTLATFCKC
ncbi:hypothetical protein ILYODFUR_037848 [Ilyodon furcidens]|uniref:Uncharacterized protein n=1 Tax=Ilyodon furcidens TaxID=33524 RepID=A0ABV0STM2_9TELE